MTEEEIRMPAGNSMQRLPTFRGKPGQTSKAKMVGYSPVVR